MRHILSLFLLFFACIFSPFITAGDFETEQFPPNAPTETILLPLATPRQKHPLTRMRRLIYRELWGESPTLPPLETPTKDSQRPQKDQQAFAVYPGQDAAYLDNVVTHLVVSGKLRHNTALRSRSMAMLTSIIATGIARHIFKGFHSNLSAMAIAASGLATGACTWLLANVCTNRGKRKILKARTQYFLEKTPIAQLSVKFLSPEKPLALNHLGSFAVDCKLMRAIDTPAFEQMHSYWTQHQRAYNPGLSHFKFLPVES
jgi:hypothetical protein